MCVTGTVSLFLASVGLFLCKSCWFVIMGYTCVVLRLHLSGVPIHFQRRLLSIVDGKF
jgi:hypothetical protein